MTTNIGVGLSTLRKPIDAGREAAETAMRQLGADRADLVLVYALSGHDQQKLLDGITSVTKDSPLSGCSAEGIITQQGSNEGTRGVCVMALASDNLWFETFCESGLPDDVRGIGARLGEGMRRRKEPGQLFLVFPDGLNVNCRRLLEGIESHWANPVAIAGGLAGEPFTYKLPTYQYYNGRAFTKSVAAVLIGGDFSFEIAVGHGCEPIGLEHTITRCRENIVETIDNRVAWDVFREFLDGDPDDLDAASGVHICVGERLTPEESRDYGELIPRGVLGLHKEDGSLYIPTAIDEGTRVVVMRRDPEKIARNVLELADRIRAAQPGRKPLAVFHYDCAARGRILLGNRTNELIIAPLQEKLGRDVPWIGFHTHGEIAPLCGKARFHNYTVVICALYEGGN
jgi:hypothetical protein